MGGTYLDFLYFDFDSADIENLINILFPDAEVFPMQEEASRKGKELRNFHAVIKPVGVANK